MAGRAIDRRGQKSYRARLLDGGLAGEKRNLRQVIGQTRRSPLQNSNGSYLIAAAGQGMC